MRISQALVGALIVSGLLGGCAAPIGVRSADPVDFQRNLARSALTGKLPSDFSLNQLRRYDLLAGFEAEPDATLAKLHAAALAEDLPPRALFALAELSFLRAEQTKLKAGYAATVVYSYALLFPERAHAQLPPLDPRERIAADLYNRALTLAFARKPDGTLALDGSGEITLPFGHLSVARGPHLLELNGYELYSLRSVSELEVRGLRNVYRRPGIGATLAAKTRLLPGVVPVVPVAPMIRMPLTAVVRIETPLDGLRTGKLRGRLDLFESLDTVSIEIDSREIPLESAPTAALAASLAESQFWKRELQVFLGNSIGLRKDTVLSGLRPYKPGRIPVVFVHGTASSPARYADMVNDLLADPLLRDRYAYWFFTYDSGNPIAYSGYQLREALSQAVARADPKGNDPCVRDMVVMGHSQGGLLTKLTVIDSGDLFWKNVSNKPFDTVTFSAKDKELLSGVLFVKPLPFVREVIFLATPQQGSYLAGPQLVRRLAEYFVRLPSDLVRVGADLAKVAATGDVDAPRLRIPTSIDNMSPGHPFIKAIATLPVAPGVITHSIIADDDDGPLDLSSDGVVKYTSSHLEPVDSELVVHSPHSGMQAAPATIEEVRRILTEHSERSACPAPVE